MNTPKIKFAKDEGLAFYKELRSEIENYFIENKIEKHGNKQMLFKIFLYFGIDILFYSLMILSTSTLEFAIYYVLMGVFVLATAFNISHDAAHQVAVKSKFWNQFLFSLSFNLQGSNAYIWGRNHNDSHHLYTNIEGHDIDVLHNPLLRMTKNQKLKWFHQYQYLYAPFLYLFYSLNWFLLRDTLLLFNFSSRTIKINIPLIEAMKLLFYKTVYVGFMIIIPIYLLPFSWQFVLMMFVITHFIISIIFVGSLGVAHLSSYVIHPLPDEKLHLNMSWPKLQMCTSVDFNAESSVLNFILGGFNAHTLHHLFPNICHVHYLKIMPIFRKVIQKYDMTYLEMPYLDSLKAHFVFLKKMGK